jgi:hypothetical protein
VANQHCHPERSEGSAVLWHNIHLNIPLGIRPMFGKIHPSRIHALNERKLSLPYPAFDLLLSLNRSGNVTR